MSTQIDTPTAAIPLELLDTEQAAHYLGISARTLEGLRKKRKGESAPRGPRFSRLSPKCVRYHIDDLRAWARDKLVETA